jgi:hypothetical protein
MPNFTQRQLAAFLTTLSETGNISMAAERTALCRTWVTRQRRTDAEFRAKTDAAIAAAQARIGACPDATPPAGWSKFGGDDLVLHGCNQRRNQIRRARPGEWTPRMEARFLGIISQCCNVTAACRELGVSNASAYRRRKIYRSFDERWTQAIEFGTVDLEYRLVENGSNFLEGMEPDYDAPIPPMTVEQCIQILGNYKKSTGPQRRRRNWRYTAPTMEQQRESIIRKIEAIERHRATEQNSWIDGGGI